MRPVLQISKKLFAELINKRTKIRSGKLMMLGANSDGVCITVYPLKRYGGCDYMPGVHQENLTENFIKLIKKGLTFAGFALLANTNQRNRGWDNMFGYDIRYGYKNTKFLIFGTRRILCKWYNPGTRKIENVRVNVVNLIPNSIIPKRGVHKSGRSNRRHSTIRQVNEAPSKMHRTSRHNSR